MPTAYDTIDTTVGLVLGHWLTLPLDLQPSGSGSALSLVSITVLDSTHLKVQFNQGAKNNVALVTQANYVITPSLAVHTIIPEAVTHPTYVTLTVDEMKDGQAYGLEIQNVEMA